MKCQAREEDRAPILQMVPREREKTCDQEARIQGRMKQVCDKMHTGSCCIEVVTASALGRLL